jgi:hypothetical protein
VNLATLHFHSFTENAFRDGIAAWLADPDVPQHESHAHH